MNQSSKASHIPGTSKVILFVDDDLDDKEFSANAVKEIDESINCIFSGNGEEALSLLNNIQPNLPDIIFLDLNMPSMNGFQFLTEIKSNKLFNKIPVVIYTTSNNDEDKKKTAMLGAAYFVSKPSSFNKICEAIARVLSQEWGKNYSFKSLK